MPARGRGAVAQVVESDRRQVKFLDECAEPVGEVLGLDRPPVGSGEHRPSLPPAAAGPGAGVAAALVGELVPEQVDGLPERLVDQPPSAGLVQGDGPGTGAALRRPQYSSPGSAMSCRVMVSSRDPARCSGSAAP